MEEYNNWTRIVARVQVLDETSKYGECMYNVLIHHVTTHKYNGADMMRVYTYYDACITNNTTREMIELTNVSSVTTVLDAMEHLIYNHAI